MLHVTSNARTCCRTLPFDVPPTPSRQFAAAICRPCNRITLYHTTCIRWYRTFNTPRRSCLPYSCSAIPTSIHVLGVTNPIRQPFRLPRLGLVAHTSSAGLVPALF